MESLDRRRDSRTAEDLLGDAMLLVLSGKRVWRPGVCPMRQLIIGTMRSIVSHWRSKPGADPEPLLGENALPVKPEEIEGTNPEPWRGLADKEDHQAVEKWFSDLMERSRGDKAVSLLLRGLREGWVPSQLVRKIGRKKYKIVVERLYRRARGNAPPKNISDFMRGPAENPA